MELWDVYDMNRVKTGKTVTRGQPIADGTYHMVVHICIFNAMGEMLVQQRQPFKQGWSNYWDITVGGSAVAGETSQQAAQRETMEEIGLQCDFSAVRPSFTINFINGFDDYYLLRREVDLTTLRLQYEEVQSVRWATLDNILSMIDDGSFIPYHTGLIHMCFEMLGADGAINKASE